MLRFRVKRGAQKGLAQKYKERSGAYFQKSEKKDHLDLARELQRGYLYTCNREARKRTREQRKKKDTFLITVNYIKNTF